MRTKATQLVHDLLKNEFVASASIDEDNSYFIQKKGKIEKRKREKKRRGIASPPLFQVQKISMSHSVEMTYLQMFLPGCMSHRRRSDA